MSSDLYYLYDAPFFSSDPFSPFNDSVSINDILLPDNENEIDEIASTLLSSSSSSPPNHQMENLSISQEPHLGDTNGFTDFTVPNVKTENFQNSFNFPCDYGSSFATSLGGCENAVKMMQKSFSSNIFEGKPRFLCQSQFMGSSTFNSQELSSLENNSGVKIRRVCSTGDLHSIKTRDRLSCSPLGTEKSFIEEENTKVVKYSAEERKERIDRYKAKRSQRNFNKTIKYQCRKTLADNRARIRGRFARNDEAVGIPKNAIFNRNEDEDDHSWAEGFNEGGNESKGSFFNSSASSQFQSYSYQ